MIIIGIFAFALFFVLSVLFWADSENKKAVISAIFCVISIVVILIEPLTYTSFHIKERTFVTDEYESKKQDIFKFDSPSQITEL